MQHYAGLLEFDVGRRLGIEVAATEGGASVSGLDEALAFAGEAPLGSLARYRQSDVVGHHFRLVVCKHAGFWQGLADGTQHDSGHVADGEHPREFRLHGPAVHGYPATFAAHPGVANDLWRTVRRNVG